MARVSINIVTWNSLRFLPECLESISKQTFRDFSILVIDNASIDGSLDYIRKNWPEAYTLKNLRNLGFARAHNQGIELARDAEYVLVINPDIMLESRFLEELVKEVEKDSRVAVSGGKLLKAHSGDPELRERIKTDIIDSAGLKVLCSRRIMDRGEGEKERGKYEKVEEVFGISGACVLYRRKALEDVKVKEEYFDQDFFSYKEDVDLAWRLRLRVWKAVYVPKARAYHFRQAAGKEKQNFFETIRRVRARSRLVSFYSYRNHLFTLVKNEFVSNFWRRFFYILGYELKKALFLLIFTPRLFFRSWASFSKFLPRMRNKRKIIMASCQVDANEVRLPARQQSADS